MKELTAGYGERIQRALSQGPRPMSVRQLGHEMEERHPDMRGATYGGVRQYAAGNIASPRVELLRAIAAVLEVRADWLAFDDGEMTEAEQTAAHMTDQRQVLPLPGGTRLSMDSHARNTLLAAWAALMDAHGGRPTQMVEETEDLLGTHVWKRLQDAVEQPLVTLSKFTGPPDRDAINDFYASMGAAIRRYARATRTDGGTDG